jgi:hypothetical protein
MSPTANGPFFGRRFGVALLLSLPGIVALAGYIYFTTPDTAVPAGLSLPLLALVSAVNPLLLLSVVCLLGAYAAPRVSLQSYVIDRTRIGIEIWHRLRDDVGLAVGIDIIGGVLIIVPDVYSQDAMAG